MKIAIVDDNRQEAGLLMNICQTYAAENQTIFDLHYFESGQTLFESFERSLYDIIFLDICMEDMNGIEIAKKIRQQDSAGLLVALTDGTEHMSEAFSFHAFEYMVKPVTRERIYQVLSDAIQTFPSMEHIISFISKRQTVQFPVSDLMYAVSSGHYVDIMSNESGMYRSRMNFNDFLKLLNGESSFLEINRGIVVNLDYVENVDENRCIIQNGSSFPVKVRERASIRQQWQNYQLQKNKQ